MNLPRLAAYAYGMIVAAATGHFLLGIPIQLTDSYGNMLKLARPWGPFLVNEFYQRSYLRPFLWAELKLVYDAAGGNYFPWFRGVHVAQIVALVLLYLGLVRPRTWKDAAIVPLGLAVLIGSHTFAGTVEEAFPINTFLTVVLCCFAAAYLSLMTHRWWVDVLAAALFVVAALTVESGLLVAVIIVGAALVGARGVSKPGVAAVLALLVGYFALRFWVLDVGSPALIERSSGYGFRNLEPSELMERFGDNPLWFYAYNIVCSALSVLVGEPRGGVFRLVYGLSIGEPEHSAIVGVISSTLATAAILAYAWHRRGAWLARATDRDDQLVLIFFIVLAANATISYPYTKDVIMSPAGALFAVAVTVALRRMLPDGVPRVPALRAAALAAACIVLSTTWALRAVGQHLNLRDTARKVRVEWVYVDDWLEGQNMRITDPRELALLRFLQRDAVLTRPGPPYLPLAENPLFDVD